MATAEKHYSALKHNSSRLLRQKRSQRHINLSAPALSKKIGKSPSYVTNVELDDRKVPEEVLIEIEKIICPDDFGALVRAFRQDKRLSKKAGGKKPKLSIAPPPPENPEYAENSLFNPEHRMFKLGGLTARREIAGDDNGVVHEEFDFVLRALGEIVEHSTDLSSARLAFDICKYLGK